MTFAVAAIDSQVASPAWADRADTGGSAQGSASGSGNGDTSTSNQNGSQSRAGSKGSRGAFGDTISSTSSSVDQGDETNSNHVNVSAHARASAKASKKQIEAHAAAGVSAQANSSEDGASASSTSYNGGQAHAVSTKKGASAYAASANGAFASAVTGVNGSTVTHVPDGITTTHSKGKKSTSISYSATGSFSVAVTRGKSAWAATGTTENVGALAAGNIRVAVRSAMSAMAMAAPGMASAYASANVKGFAENSFGKAQAYGHAYAFASVERTGRRVVVSVATSTGPDNCGAQWWKKSVQKRECIVRHKVINLKATSKTKATFAVLGKSKTKNN